MRIWGRSIFLAALLSVSCFPANATGRNDAPEYHGQLTFHYCGTASTFSGLPRFEDYPAEHKPRKKAADIDFKSNPSAHAFRTRLRDGLKTGPNFNGHYSVVTFGCGTQCQGHLIVDIETGKVISTDQGTSYGAAYRMDSSLIAFDLPAPDASWVEYHFLAYGGPRFFFVKNGKAGFIKKEDVSSVAAKGSFDCKDWKE